MSTPSHHADNSLLSNTGNAIAHALASKSLQAYPDAARPSRLDNTPRADGTHDMASRFAHVIDSKVDGNSTRTARTAAAASTPEASNTKSIVRAKRSDATGTPDILPASAGSNTSSAPRDRSLAHLIGPDIVHRLGWKKNKFTRSETTELAVKFIANHALHGDRADHAGLLAALTAANKRLHRNTTASTGGKAPVDAHDKLAGHIADFLHTMFSTELLVAHAAADLAGLRPPTRTRRAGAEETADPNAVADPDAAAASNTSDAEFSRQFDAYTQLATDKTIVLFDRWLSWIGKAGMEIKDARIEVQTASLQTFRREVTFTLSNALVNNAKVLEDVPAAGYFAVVHEQGRAHQYFLSTEDGGIHPIPPGELAPDWAARHPDIVFGVPRDRAMPDPRATSRRTRVVLQPLAQGPRADMRTWLAPVLQERFNRARPATPDSQPAGGVADTLLNFIPFRRMIVAIRDGDYATAALSGTIDLASVAIPMMGYGLRLTANAAARVMGRGIAIKGVADGGSATLTRQEMQSDIKTVLESMQGTHGLAQGLHPLDVEDIAATLRHSEPRVANALERTGARARDAHMRQGWRLPDVPASPVSDEAIRTLSPVVARGPDGATMRLLPYGSTVARAFTRAQADGSPTGMVLLADADGWLHPSLPVNILESHRISDADLLRSLSARRPGPNGVISHGGGSYARIADEYVEIRIEPASTSAHPVYRVMAPKGVPRDIVFHRISYDPDKAMWLRADPGELKGGSPPSTSRQGKRSRPSSSDGNRPEQAQSSGKAVTEDAAPLSPRPAPVIIPAALPMAAPGSAKLNAFKQVLLTRIADTVPAARINGVRGLLDRIQADPRGRTILGAMCAYHELTGRTADIVLLEEADPLRPRPLLTLPRQGQRWHLNLDALNAANLNTVVNELAAVYNDLTGILQGGDPFIGILRGGGPSLTTEEETALANWVGADKGHYAPEDPALFIPSQRQAAADKLRAQLKHARCHGGVDALTLIKALRNHPSARIPGLKLDLSHLHLTDIPPLPADVRDLVIYNNPIEDWSRLPVNLDRLDASQTSATVLDHLSPHLRQLDISDNLLERLPVDKLPRGLTHLTSNFNPMTEIPAGLPDTLVHLSLDDNALTACPADLPRGLRLLNLSGNRLTRLSGNLPPDLETLDLSEDFLLEIADGALPGRLRTLGLSDNPDLHRLPKLSDTLRVLHLDACGLTELPEDLPRDLRELYASSMRLVRLPDNLPRRLKVLAVGENELTRLPADIIGLTNCDIYLDDNPIVAAELPALPAGQRYPVFHLSLLPPELPGDASRSVAQAVRHWLGEDAGEVASRWESIDQKLENSPAERSGMLEFRRLLDRMRDSSLFRDNASRVHVREWLEELCKPERGQLLKSTLKMCDDANESCDDRVILTWNELRKLRLHDDIHMGHYKGRAADALRTMRQLFHEYTLQGIAYRMIVRMTVLDPDTDDVEVYLALITRLREALELVGTPKEMLFFNRSGVTQADIDNALREVRAAEHTDFYKSLVVDETWKILIKQELPARYEQAEARLLEQADGPLRERIRAELSRQGLDPDDEDAYRNIAPSIWRDMQYEILEPLTREYLESAGVPLSAGAPAAPGAGAGADYAGRQLDRSRRSMEYARAGGQRPTATGELHDRRYAAGARPG